jgi:hypothetical protein
LCVEGIRKGCMRNENARIQRRGLKPLAEAIDLFPAMQHRKQVPLDPQVDMARRELWRAFQRGTLSEEELASTLDRLGTAPSG